MVTMAANWLNTHTHTDRRRFFNVKVFGEDSKILVVQLLNRNGNNNITY